MPTYFPYLWSLKPYTNWRVRIPLGRDLSSEFVDLYPHLPLNFRKSLNQGWPRDGESRDDEVSNRDMIFIVLVSDGHLSGRAREVLNAAGYLRNRYEVVEDSLCDRNCFRIVRWSLNTMHHCDGYDREPVFAKNVFG
jgi:hypothetical protein